MSKANLQQKTGKISNVEEIAVDNNTRTMLRIVIQTASSMNFEEAMKNDDISSFILASNERTEFSTLMPTIENLPTETIAKAMIGKVCKIIVAKATIKDLSNGKIERVKYTAKDGSERITSTMSRTYILGSQNADENVSFEAMKNDLMTRLNDGDFEPYSLETPQPQPQQTAPKFQF